MSTDAVTLRAELKTFEREFKQEHGRTPSIDEIKAAGFAERYKLYKKLAKSGQSSSSSSLLLPSAAKSAARPSTPPRSVPRRTEPPTSIIPKSRAVTTEIASSSNPFSPVKDKGKQKEKHKNVDPPLPNPFATPSKGKSVQRPPTRLLSPDPFPLIDAPRPTQERQPGSSNPVSRARKRLRGEPVSPSPVKEKRARTAPDAVLPFPKLSTLTADDSDADDDRAGAAELSFVADSPVKLPPKGAFKVLFNEDLSAPLSANRLIAKSTLARSKSKSASNGSGGRLFGARSQRTRSMSRSSDDLPQDDNQQMPEMNPGNRKTQDGKAKIGRRTRIDGFTFTKDNLFDSVENPTSPPGQTSRQSDMNSKTSSKRPLDDGDVGVAPSGQPNQLPLLPPSPPPAGTGSGASYKGKGKAKIASRKKLKLLEDAGDEDDDSSSDGMHVRVREFTQRRPERDPDADFDPVFALGALDRPQNIPTPGPGSDSEPGEFDVNLPDDLRRMLAIDPAKAHDAQETGLVRGVLYGVRTTHYDGLKGGDIWDAGEVGGTEGEEEDWEGEPVPWEAGEL